MTEMMKMGKKKRKWDAAKTVFIVVMLVWPMVQFAFFYVYMNASNIAMAFQGLRPDGSKYFVGFKNFISVFNGVDSSLIRISFFNNLKMFFFTTILGLPLNVLFSYYLYKKKPGTTAIRIIYMLPSMVSGVVMTLLFMKFVEFGLPALAKSWFDVKTFPNLIRNSSTAFGVQVFYSLWLGFSSSLIIYSNAMFSIDESIIEAGKIDGMSNGQEIIYIIVPLIFPTMSTYIITGVSCIFTLSGSLYLFYGLRDVPTSTYLMGYYLFRIGLQGDLTQYPVSAAVSIIITVITIPITLGIRAFLNRIDPMRDVHSDIA